MNVADFAAVSFVGFNVDAAVRVPKTDGTIFAAAQAIIAVAVESRR